MSLFKDQTLLDIILDTKITLTGASTTDIHYKKPSGAEGNWVGVVDPANAKNIKYAVTTGDIDETGPYKLQAVVVIGGRTGYGDIIEVDFILRLTDI
jgi:hypothetical protein